MWHRDPFLGGCSYYSSLTGEEVMGHYSPSNPMEFEGDCRAWEASNLPGQIFLTADEAMDASDAA